MSLKLPLAPSSHSFVGRLGRNWSYYTPASLLFAFFFWWGYDWITGATALQDFLDKWGFLLYTDPRMFPHGAMAARQVLALQIEVRILVRE